MPEPTLCSTTERVKIARLGEDHSMTCACCHTGHFLSCEFSLHQPRHPLVVFVELRVVPSMPQLPVLSPTEREDLPCLREHHRVLTTCCATHNLLSCEGLHQPRHPLVTFPSVPERHASRVPM